MSNSYFRKINITYIVLLLSLFISTSDSLFSQGPEAGKTYRYIMFPEEKLEPVNDSDMRVKFKALASELEVKAGEEFQVTLEMQFDEYWYTYSLKEQISSEGIGPTRTEIYLDTTNKMMQIGDPKGKAPKSKFDKGFEMDIKYYKEKVVFKLNAKAVKDINFANDREWVGVYLQLCDTARCLPPEEFRVYINDSKTAAVSDAAESDGTGNITESEQVIEDAKDEGVFSFLWLAMSMGALALLTPCVFPMIPITVSFFTKRAEKSKGKGIRDSLVYTIGIISTFTLLGMILAAILGPTGIQDFATNGWVNIVIALVFIIFALNLFGAFEIQMPTGLMNKLNAKSQGSGITSVLLMGLTFSLTSFTCTVPFVGSTLISTASGEWFYPIIGMLGFSAVFAAPFFLLALFPSIMQSLPKAGGWMNNVKVVMGFLEIAAAIKFISNADLVWSWGMMPKELFLSIWIGCSVLITLYVIGLYRLPHDSPVNGVNSVRIVFAIFFATITFYLISGLFGKPLGELDSFLPPPDYREDMAVSTVGTSAGPDGISGVHSAHENWIKDYNEAVKIAKRENKHIFIDFTGKTCTNCRWMEVNMFTKPAVSLLMNNMIKVKLYTDRKTESDAMNKKMQMEQYNSIALPLYVILTPDEKLVGTKEFTRDEKDFISFLERAFE